MSVSPARSIWIVFSLSVVSSLSLVLGVLITRGLQLFLPLPTYPTLLPSVFITAGFLGWQAHRFIEWLDPQIEAAHQRRVQQEQVQADEDDA